MAQWMKVLVVQARPLKNSQRKGELTPENCPLDRHVYTTITTNPYSHTTYHNNFLTFLYCH